MPYKLALDDILRTLTRNPHPELLTALYRRCGITLGLALGCGFLLDNYYVIGSESSYRQLLMRDSRKPAIS